MKFKVAYVPFDESFIVFCDGHILFSNLTEQKAKELSLALNTMEFQDIGKLSDKTIPHPKSGVYNFETVYDRFPRKKGKATGLKRLKSMKWTDAKYTALLRAADYYRHYCEVENVEEKYQLYFSTWVNRWEDWIPPEEAVKAGEPISFDEISKQMQL